jgi:hypothetical protein
MQWISVKERLPEVDETQSSNSEDVLILDSDGTMYVGHMDFYPVAGYRKESKVTWSENATGCGCCAEGLHPTHWMPLPKPPGQE